MAGSLIVLAGLVAYANSFSGEFVLDDVTSISHNPTIRQLQSLRQVLSPPRNGETVCGRPLLNLSLAINYAFSGTQTRAYHITNLVIHLLNALLLLGILRRSFLLPALRSRLGDAASPLACAIAMLWSVHPLQTESVTYIVQRAESLAGLFYLLVLYSVIRGSQSKRRVRWYILAVVACFLGAATKEAMVTAPLVVLLYDRTFLGGSFRKALRRRWGLYLGLVASWGLLAMLLTSTGLLGRGREFGASDPWSYARSQPGVILNYLRLSLWPHRLSLVPFWASDSDLHNLGWPLAQTPGSILLAAMGIALLVVATVRGLIGGRKWGFLGAWFFLVLAPTSSILPLGELSYEHRTYLSLAAVATAVIVGGYIAGEGLARRGWLPGRAGLVAGACLVTVAAVILGLLTFRRNDVYRCDLSLWQDTLSNTPHHAQSYYIVGLALYQRGRVAEAIEHYQQALRINRDHVLAHNNLGLALAGRGQCDEAIAHYRKALEIKPDFAEAHNNLG